MNKTAIWDAVVKTDPKYTKRFRRAGGFEGTAINFAYLARKATEMFGPVGIGWGAKVLDEEYVRGAPMGDGRDEVVHVVRIEFWYMHDGVRGTIESYGQTLMVGKNRHGYFTDEEAPKKSLTDAMSKAMSWLGFAADVHLGLYDDNKYIADLRSEFSDKEPSFDDERLAEEVRGISNKDEFEIVRKKVFAACAAAGQSEAWARLRVELGKRAKELGIVPEKRRDK